jgi:PPM family protein phosphatase
MTAFPTAQLSPIAESVKFTGGTARIFGDESAYWRTEVARMAKYNSETVDSFTPELAAAKFFVRPAGDLAYEFGAASHVGLHRSENQDHYIVVRRTRTQQLLLTNVPTEMLTLPTDEAFGMAVADGMGGTGRGSLASQLAIRSAWEMAGRTTSWVMKLEDLNSTELAERVEGFVHRMQEAFLDEFHSNPEFTASGTTWTSAYFVSSFAVVAQIGDSPSFLWRDGTMGRITTDHTVEQEFIAAGVSPEIAGKYGHMLTRCLGFDSPTVRPSVYHLRLHPGDQILICSDGITDAVDACRIAACIDDAPSAQAACDGLVELALAAGGKDNATAVLARAKSR